MPSVEAVEILIRREPLGEGEWVRLLDARRKLIAPILGEITLPELGSVRCLHSEGFLREIGRSVPTISLGHPSPDEPSWSLRTQGVFDCAWASREKTGPGFNGGPGSIPVPDGRLRIWGLTRNGEWIIATVSYEGHAGYKDRGQEVATKIEIREVSIPVLLAMSKYPPLGILGRLTDFVREAARRRREQWERLERLADMAASDDALIEFALKQR